MKSKTTRHGLKRMTALLLALVLCIGINFLGMTKIKVMNYVPAVFFPILLCTFM